MQGIVQLGLGLVGNTNGVNHAFGQGPSSEVKVHLVIGWVERGSLESVSQEMLHDYVMILLYLCMYMHEDLDAVILRNCQVQVGRKQAWNVEIKEFQISTLSSAANNQARFTLIASSTANKRRVTTYLARYWPVPPSIHAFSHLL